MKSQLLHSKKLTDSNTKYTLEYRSVTLHYVNEEI